MSIDVLSFVAIMILRADDCPYDEDNCGKGESYGEDVDAGDDLYPEQPASPQKNPGDSIFLKTFREYFMQFGWNER